jgi:uncharacterized protein YndB with AHSA1/START domain
MSDRIEKRIELKAPVSKVWSALTDYRQFGAWFCVNVENPFVPGEVARGVLTFPGYEGRKWEVTIVKMEPERLFSYTWHPYALDGQKDYSQEIPTLVEFTLERISIGTLLTVIESGFDKIPTDRRAEAFRSNEGGWAQQLKNIEKYVAPAA